MIVSSRAGLLARRFRPQQQPPRWQCLCPCQRRAYSKPNRSKTTDGKTTQPTKLSKAQKREGKIAERKVLRGQERERQLERERENREHLARLKEKSAYKPSLAEALHKEAEAEAKAKAEAEPPPTLLSIWKTHWLPLSGAALLAGALGFYIIGTLTATYNSPCACNGHAVPTGRPPALTGENAEAFDKELDLPEWWMGITKLRRRLAQQAKGEVLELAMGSGRNLEYYEWAVLSAAMEGKTTAVKGITSFTGLDISADMLDVARRKLVKAVPPMKDFAPVVKASTMPNHMGAQLSYLSNHLRLITSDAHNALPTPPMHKKYDTVVQTFGLCSVSDPVAVLQNLARSVKPETGRILLLEHGKGYLGVMNGMLDRNAGRHFEKYGCWWNRDIQALVEEAAEKTPGLEVVKVERPNWSQMGTLVWVELKVAQK